MAEGEKSALWSKPVASAATLAAVGVGGVVLGYAVAKLFGAKESDEGKFYYREQKTSGLPPALHDYVVEVGTRETKARKMIEEYTKSLGRAQRMLSSAEEGALLTILCKSIRAKRVVDVGTFTGYSALHLALGVREEGLVVTVDVSDRHLGVAREAWKEAGVAEKIEVRLRPALEVLEALRDEYGDSSFDAVFLDAVKEEYVEYYEKAMRLLRPGGLVLVDNTLWSGRVISPEHIRSDADTQAIRRFNDHVHGDPRIQDIALVPVADGLTILRKK